MYARAEDGCEDVDRLPKSPLCVSHLPALDALAAHPDHSAVSASFPRLWGFLSTGPSGRRAAVPGGAGWKQKLWLLHLLFPEAGTHCGFCKQRSGAQPQMDVVVGGGVATSLPHLHFLEHYLRES